jgi:ferrous iron transport protein B
MKNEKYGTIAASKNKDMRDMGMFWDSDQSFPWFPKSSSSSSRESSKSHFYEEVTVTSQKADQLEHSYAGYLGHLIEPIIAPLGFDWKIGIGLIAAQAAREVFISTLAIIYHVQHDEENPSSLSTTLLKETRSTGAPVYTPLTCLSILIFFVLSMQCMSTLAVVRRETNSLRWPLFQFCYMSGAAYLASLLVYQGGMLLGFH